MHDDHEPAASAGGKRTVRQLDARSLRALAHPMRVEILNALAQSGPLTGTALADRLQLRTGSISWHLQKLAEHGFVEEALHDGDRRERWWRVTNPYWSVDAATYMGDHGTAGATAALLSAVLAQHAAGATQFLHSEWPRRWREAFVLQSEPSLRLTASQLIELRDEISAVLNRFRHRAGAAEDAEWVQFQMQAFPYHRTTADAE